MTEISRDPCCSTSLVCALDLYCCCAGGRGSTEKTSAKEGRGDSTGLPYWLVGVCVSVHKYTQTCPAVLSCVLQIWYCSTLGANLLPVPAAIWCGWLRVTALLLHLVSCHEAQWSLDWTFPFHFAQFIWFYTNVNRGCDKTGDKMDWAQSTC